MKEVKINFWGFWKDFDIENNNLVSALSKYFKVYISNTPDFVFCSWFANNDFPFKNCIKIFYSEEAHTVPLNLYDYVIAPIKVNLKNKYFLQYKRFPIIDNEKRKILPETLVDRKFCNFIYYNDNVGNNVLKRIEFCQKLSKYKQVDCPGVVLNNMKNAITPRFGDWEQGKLDFIKDYKFTIAFENNIIDSYSTEKIYHPFMVNSVPIYSGNPRVTEDYNPLSFINASDYSDFDELIERIIELDNNDDLYMKMLREPVYNKEPDYDLKLERFLVNIINRGNNFFNRLKYWRV